METYQIVTDRIIAQLDKGIIPWKRGFAVNGPSMPTNFQTKKEYRGINILMLFCSGYDTNEWLTYKQAADLGGHVKRGEKGIPIVFWSIRDDEEPSESGKSKRHAFSRTYTVFNLDQIEGINRPLPFDAGRVFDPIPSAQAIANAYLGSSKSPALAHGGVQPFYSPTRDLIQMPAREVWYSPERYYKTLFHEMAHSTGHDSRLKRPFGNRFGSDPYAKEELIAEFTAAFLCASCGISNEETESNSVAYIQSWIANFKNDPKLAMSAAQKAQRAADFIQGRVFGEVEAEEPKAA